MTRKKTDVQRYSLLSVASEHLAKRTWCAPVAKGYGITDCRSYKLYGTY